MSSLVNVVLFLALVLTSLCVLAMYRKLRQLDSYRAEYKIVFQQTAQALDSAGAAVRTFNDEGRELLETLGKLIEEAKVLKSDLEELIQEAQGLDRHT